MDHQHLLPNEIDLLVDGDASPGVSALRSRLAECDDCRARYDELRIVSDAVEAVPHFMPKLRFADAIMTNVQVVEPWHVALAGSATRLVPAGTLPRRLALVGAAIAGVAISGSAAWLAFRGDLTAWVFTLVVDRTIEGIVTGAGDAATSILGADAATTLAAGGLSTLAITTAVLATATIGALLAFRRIAATAAARRS